ncbi:UPF0420 [Chlorella sorokiniana]|uniref:UPF0420 n=1 Tax=Chlorella sorokiniana TaxID=3076 RepID=A0A2P6TJL5_CHLSO|nr:UPF0420 [Chlorella sorokiniana]|eukprot:PRW44259.1 UPF0420 [Chlorella sorokiniana]
MGAAGAVAHRGLALACLALLFVGWAIFLGGVASLQQACPNALAAGTVASLPAGVTPAGGAGLPASLEGLISPQELQRLAAQGGQSIQDELARLRQQGRRLTQDTSLGGLLASVAGQPGYLAPVPCNKLFSYPWWIWAFLTFMFVMLALGVTTFMGRLRGMLVALSAALLVLLMNTANTFLYVNYIDGLPGTIAARGRVLAAGAIISSIAMFLLIMVLGWHNEDAALETEYDTETTGKKKGRKTAGGGVLGKLGLKKGREEGAEEEPPGAGTAGSPRYIQVPPPTAGAMPAGSPGGGAGAGPAPGTIIPGPISSHGPAIVGGGLGIGYRGGRGIVLARLPPLTASGPPRWSAPIFVKVDTFALSMTSLLLEQLAAGRTHSLTGVDQSLVALGSEVQDKSDVVAASTGASDLVAVSHSSGVMFDFSLTGGSLSVDQSKMATVYGEAARQVAQVIKGTVEGPAELAPLYDKLSELCTGGHTELLSRTRVSLERMTAGYDPDRRVVTDSTAGEPRILTSAAAAGPPIVVGGSGMHTMTAGGSSMPVGTAGTVVAGPEAGQRVAAGPIGAGRGMPVR